MNEEEMERIERGSPTSLVEAGVIIGFGLAVALLLGFICAGWWL